MGLFFRKNSGGGSAVTTNALQDEKQKADIIINNIDDAIVLIDSANVIRSFNPASSTMTGWPKDEVLGLDYRSVIKFVNDKGETIDDSDHPFVKVLLSGKPFRDNTSILAKKDGSALSVDISVTPLVAADGKISGAVAIIRDVEDQRKQDKQRADFISTASHEMRTPVAAIEGYLALALNDKVTNIDAKARSYLEKAHASTQHLGKLFQDLLTSAKAEDGRLSNHPQVLEMNEFVEKLVDDLRFSAEKKGLALELLMGSHQQNEVTKTDSTQKVVKPLLFVHVDPDRIREVITNLFDNAVKYTETGKITIGITGDAQVVQFHISDTGPGIPKDDIPHLFQKFYRVDNSNTRTIGGTGLGLYICKKIVELYNGRIWVESEQDKGSTFYINLPRLETNRALTLQAQEGTVAQPVIQNAKI
ncbi:PAS domain-containing sensor histidine kinase [Candidatus Saccharibacteria bacterium]|nr:PAS domain-containing sensor histidine kinase [Candidatus Saccharibacteria bacterium]